MLLGSLEAIRWGWDVLEGLLTRCVCLEDERRRCDAIFFSFVVILVSAVLRELASLIEVDSPDMAD